MHKHVTIFIRTFAKDAPWLVQFFRSYDKFASGFADLIVHCDRGDLSRIVPIVGSRGHVVSSPVWAPEGYQNQQIVKLHCDLWVKTPYVLFCDSDYLWCSPGTPESFFVDDKPHILKTSYASLGGSVPWQACVERIAKEPVEFEFMRGPRLIHCTEAFPALRRWIEQNHKTPDVGHWLAHQHNLSEFNLIGWFAHKFMQDRYRFADTAKEPLPVNPLRQFWSNGGITPAIKAEVNALLA